MKKLETAKGLLLLHKKAILHEGGYGQLLGPLRALEQRLLNLASFVKGQGLPSLDRLYHEGVQVKRLLSGWGGEGAQDLVKLVRIGRSTGVTNELGRIKAGGLVGIVVLLCFIVHSADQVTRDMVFGTGTGTLSIRLNENYGMEARARHVRVRYGQDEL